jgi:hypothetical protein
MPKLLTHHHKQDFAFLSTLKDVALLDRLEEANLFSTGSEFENTFFRDLRPDWFDQNQLWQTIYSEEYKELLPHVFPGDVNVMASPSVGKEASRLLTERLIGGDITIYHAQMVRCSHVDWHTDEQVALNNGLQPGVHILCLSDNPYNMALRMRSGEVHVFERGDWLYFNDSIEHSLLPIKPIQAEENALNERPLMFLVFQKYTQPKSDDELFDMLAHDH